MEPAIYLAFLGPTLDAGDGIQVFLRRNGAARLVARPTHTLAVLEAMLTMP
jgi:hypothetical protein